MNRVHNHICLRYLQRTMPGLIIGVVAILIAGCTTPSPDTSHHIIATPTVFSWAALQQRPLHLPSLKSGTSCPTTHGRQVIPGFSDFLEGKGPIYADFFGVSTSDQEQGVLRYVDAQTFEGGTSGWGGQKVLWFIDPAYHGPALIRGQRLDGPGQVRFDSETNQLSASAADTLLTALQIIGGGNGKPWPNWGSNTRLQNPGCYAYQIDGPHFSTVIIFQAIAIHSSH